MDDLAEMRRLTKLLPIHVRDSLARAFGLTTLHRLLLSKGGAAAHKLTTGPSADKSGVESPAFSDGATRGKKTARALAKSQNRRSRSNSQSVKMTGSVQSAASSASRPLTGNIRLS